METPPDGVDIGPAKQRRGACRTHLAGDPVHAALFTIDEHDDSLDAHALLAAARDRPQRGFAAGDDVLDDRHARPRRYGSLDPALHAVRLCFLAHFA